MSEDSATQQPHYHVFHGLPGYLPEGDTPEPGIKDVRQAMLVLAEDLSDAADRMMDTINLGEGLTDDELAQLEEQADGLYAVAENLEKAAQPWPGTDRYPGTVTIGDGVQQVSAVAKYGLMIDGAVVRYELQPCWEAECDTGEE